MNLHKAFILPLVFCTFISPFMYSVTVHATVSTSGVSAASHTEKKTVQVAYIGMEKADEFEITVKPTFQNYLRSCKGCELVNYTPYDKNGDVNINKMAESIEELKNISFIFFNFNLPLDLHNKNISQVLGKKIESGVLVIGAAGHPNESQPSLPLNQTVLGIVPKLVIIGELGERDRLYPAKSFYGPEMLTALRPPKELIAQGKSPLIFSARLASEFSKRSAPEWSEHFITKKQKSRKLWLDYGDLL